MKKSQETTLQGVKFQTTKYNPKRSLRMITKLGRLIGRPLGGALGSLGGTGTLGDMLDGLDGDLFGKALQALFFNLDEADLPAVLEDIFKGTRIQIEQGGKLIWLSIDIDRDFEDSLMLIYEVAEWVLRFNFENFSDELKERIGLLQEEAETESSNEKAEN